MAEDQDFNQRITIITQDTIVVLAEAAEHKKVLTGVIIEEIPDDDKLAKLRQVILKYNASMQDFREKPVQSIITKRNEDTEEDFLDKLHVLTHTLDHFNAAMRPFSELFAKIGTIMRQEVAPDKKIHTIGDLLL